MSAYDIIAVSRGKYQDNKKKFEAPSGDGQPGADKDLKHESQADFEH